MLLIECPWCGARHESEFENGGPVHALRPQDASTLSEEEWLNHLMVKPNPIGPLRERWWHARGCGQWFEISRDTSTHEILAADDDT